MKWFRKVFSNQKLSSAVEPHSLLQRILTFFPLPPHQMRDIQTVGVWPVAFTGAARWAGPICKHGHVVGFHTNWKPFRTFPIDMAAFAINLKMLLVDRPTARFDPDVKPGFLETSFLDQITTMEDMEPKAGNCLKVSSM